MQAGRKPCLDVGRAGPVELNGFGLSAEVFFKRLYVLIHMHLATRHLPAGQLHGQAGRGLELQQARNLSWRLEASDRSSRPGAGQSIVARNLRAPTVGVHRPLKIPFLFSRKARIPSFWSSVEKRK
jgi:hypothetical protein